MLSKEELGEWIKVQFLQATEGNEATWQNNQVHLTADCANNIDYQVHLVVLGIERYI